MLSCTGTADTGTTLQSEGATASGVGCYMMQLLDAAPRTCTREPMGCSDVTLSAHSSMVCFSSTEMPSSSIATASLCWAGAAVWMGSNVGSVVHEVADLSQACICSNTQHDCLHSLFVTVTTQTASCISCRWTSVFSCT